MWPREDLESLTKLAATWGVGIHKRAGDRDRDRDGAAHRFLIGLLVEGLAENSHDEEVDDEGHGEGNGGLDQEVHVGFSNVRPAGSVHLPRLGRSEGKGRTKVPQLPNDPCPHIYTSVFSESPFRESPLCGSLIQVLVSCRLPTSS